MLTAEFGAILKAQRTESVRGRSHVVAVGLEDLVEQRFLVELDSEIIVRPRLPRTFRTRIATAHGAQMAERDSAMLRLQRPSEVRDGLVHARHQSFLDREKEERAQHRLGGREPVADLRLVSPSLDHVPLFDDAAATSECLGQRIQLGAIDTALLRHAL